MQTYTFTRELVDGSYNIDNPLRVDGEGNQIYLAKEIETALPGKSFKLKCNATQVEVIFTEVLSAEEIDDLTAVINNHKNNV